MPKYDGPLIAWACGACRGVIHFKPPVEPAGLRRCGMMGCSGTLRRMPELDIPAEPEPGWWRCGRCDWIAMGRPGEPILLHHRTCQKRGHEAEEVGGPA